jgi:probable rRNA maturation factor
MGTAKRASRAARTKAAKARREAVEISVQRATQARRLPSARLFGRWARAALNAGARVTVRLVGMREGRALNRTYRGRDYATNVLTFVLDDGPPYDGDLVLCAPVVSREARDQGKDLMAHYAHLTVHGVLHLMGYEHERERDASRMEKLETRILRRLGYPDPYDLPEHGRQSQ